VSRDNHNLYDDSGLSANRPLRLDEVEAMVLDGGRIFLKDRERIVHLLERMAATIKDHGRRMSELHDDVDRIRAERSEKEHPITRASAALAELDLEQQAKLLDTNYIAAMERVQEDQGRAERMLLLAVNDVNRVRLLLAGLKDDDSITPDAREKIDSLLAHLPPVRNI
jgi:septal ring factor EnvC (AmiA/AmiB activator)